jgi:serine/threonine-protein kinase
MSNDPERKRRFFQEAQAASALNHPNIITLYDIVSEGDMQCIVMEYIGGKTLRDLIPPGGLPPGQALQYAAQIASALTAAHDAHIIHRDLKPSNIMVTTSGLVKVLDFGLAKWVDSGIAGQTGEQSTMETALTREGSIIGTVSYMSPEQAEGKRVDGRSDIFSFGSVLYEMLTGTRAFEGRSGISTLSSILRDDVKPIYEAAPDVPPLLEQIVLRCLPKEPAARWQSMKEIEAALHTLQRQLDPEGHFASPLPAGQMPLLPPSPAPPFLSTAAASAASPLAATSVSTDSDPSIEFPPLASVLASNGPSKTSPSLLDPSRLDPSRVGLIRTQPPKPPIARARVIPRPSRTPPLFLVVILGLIGVALVAGVGIGGWYWWKSHYAAPQPVTIAEVPHLTPAPPPAVQVAPPPAETPPAETAPAVKPKRRHKPKPDKTATLPPVLAPVLPPPPPPRPAPVAAPPPAPPKPAPKPLIQIPVVVSDALPFVINLAQDVPADAAEGETLRFTVGQPLQVGDKTVIAKGAAVSGVVIRETKKKFLGIGGHKLTFRLAQVQAVDGRKLAVRAVAGKSEDGLAVRTFETGKTTKSKGYAALQGTEYIGYIDGDQIVAVRK